MMNFIKEVIKGTHNDTQQKNRPIDCDGVQMVNAHC